MALSSSERGRGGQAHCLVGPLEMLEPRAVLGLGPPGPVPVSSPSVGSW